MQLCFEKCLLKLKEHDKRWSGEWKEIEVMINPNGPLFNGGSDGDNGQTGRKLVIDYYGPRIPLGGGALYGKDLSHIDRLGSYSARKFALELVAKKDHQRHWFPFAMPRL
ncbi:MAG: methionine adenosyltransferase domain-containing protein [Ignavibacteria bacterium]|nr:methionine adenosyltransferase domain-containing protein [Ignavibacteria bacterium]